MLIGRVLTAMATPMAAHGAVDLDGAATLADHLVAAGNDGIVVAGTTGEAPTLTHQETLAVVRTVVETVGDRATVVAGVGKNDTAATVALSREVAGLGVDALLVVTPYYNRPSQRGLLAHFGAVAEATDLPVVLYDIPGRTGTSIDGPTQLALAEVPTVVGVKDAAQDPAKTAWVAARKPDTYAQWAGDDAALLWSLALGGAGVVSVVGHLVGPDLAAIVDAFATDPAKAREIFFRVAPLMAALFAEPSPAPLKAALGMVGLPGGGVRAPLVDAGDDTRALLRDALATAGVATTS